MFSKVDPPDLDLKNPWNGDLFQRDRFAGTLCTLLKGTSHSTVIGIDAPYGFGKTFFLRRLSEQIKLEKGWVVYVNAWEYDYFDSALFALLDALKLAAEELPDKKSVKKIIGDIGKAAAPAIAKAASKKIMESLLSEDGSEDVVNAITEATGKSTKAILERFSKEDTTHQTLEHLRKHIREFVAGHIDETSPYKNLIIIVDELDRARPNFGIRFLETIKHLFSISQITFIVGCDRSALISSAKHEFGGTLDVNGYLRRLFDYWIDLPPPKPEPYIFACAQKLNLISENIMLNDHNDSRGIQFYSKMLLLGRRGEDASLRFIEQSVAHAGLVLRLAPTDRQVGLIGWIQNLREFAPELYQVYVSNQKVSQMYAGLQKYAAFNSAKAFDKAWIILWAANSLDRLTKEVLDHLFGSDRELLNSVGRIAEGANFYFDDRESMAYRIDRRMRTISIQT